MLFRDVSIRVIFGTPWRHGQKKAEVVCQRVMPVFWATVNTPPAVKVAIHPEHYEFFAGRFHAMERLRGYCVRKGGDFQVAVS